MNLFIVSYHTDMKSILDIIRPELAYLNTLYWLTDTEGGPTDGKWYYHQNNSDIQDSFIVPVELFDESSTWLHRPGMMLEYGEHLCGGESAFYISINADNDAVATENAIHLYNNNISTFYDHDFCYSFGLHGVIFATTVAIGHGRLLWNVCFNTQYERGLLNNLYKYINRHALYNISIPCSCDILKSINRENRKHHLDVKKNRRSAHASE